MSHNRGFARYTVSSAVKSLADPPVTGVTLPGTALSALITNRDATNHLLWRDDGTDPTVADSMILYAGATMSYDGDLSKFRMIRASADVSITISYYSET
jgi:hypothetical protein